MNKIIKILFISVLALMGMTACSATQESIENEFNTLWDATYEAAKNGDKETFIDNFTSSSSSEYIDQVFDWFQSFDDSYQSMKTEYIGENEGKYYFYRGFYSVSNAYTTNYSTNYSTGFACIEKEDGKWKFNYTDEVNNEIIAVILTSNYYGEDAKAAYEAGRCYFISNSIKAKNSPNSTFPGALDTSIDSAWQNEDGSVTVVVSLSNGMEEPVYFSDGEASLLNANSEVIFNSILNFDIEVPAGTTKYEEFLFDSNEVNFELWDPNNYMSYEINNVSHDY